ncbi:MAG: anti-sigma F factor [Clostridia bacterium]|nr:anti-sigma F factor [Clostridia bacterium]
MKTNNYIQLKIPALSQNEYLARSVVGALFAELNPTIEQLADVKTAVSEAVTNCIVHAYQDEKGVIEINAWLEGTTIHIKIIDTGVGIEDVNQAMTPFFSSKPNADRSGMGFTVMQSFMDELKVSSTIGKGTTIDMKKTI